MVSENDLWEGGNNAPDEDYVLVRQDDIVDGIACFMAAYLISLKETKVHVFSHFLNFTFTYLSNCHRYIMLLMDDTLPLICYYQSLE